MVDVPEVFEAAAQADHAILDLIRAIFNLARLTGAADVTATL